MASTGVAVDDAAVALFSEFKKSSNKTKFIIFKIEGDKIITEHQSENNSFGDFLSMLPSDDCRYALYKMDFTTTDGRPNTKLAFVAWSPDSAKVKPKMVYAGSKEAITRVCVGVSVKVTATDMSELTEEIVQEACRKFA